MQDPTFEGGWRMSTYALTSHTYACRTRHDHVVLLDLRRDKYFALDDVQSRDLTSLVPQLSDGTQPSDPSSSEHCLELAQVLIEQGLLLRTQGPDAIARVEVEVAERTLSDQYSGNEIPIKLHHILRFIYAFLAAKYSLSRRPIESVVRRLERRLARLGEQVGHGSPEKAVIEICTVFERLRPWFYVAKDACLLDSIVLIEFLLLYREPASLVFGVTSGPFGAHAWGQKGDLVLNDKTSSVRRFKPILVLGPEWSARQHV